MHLRCQSFVAVAPASPCRLSRIVAVAAAFLLTTWLMAQPAEGRPLDRQRRAAIADVIADTASLSNPCASTPTSASVAGCPADGSVHLYAQRARDSLVKLQLKLDPTPHSDLNLTPAIYQPATTADMTNQQKLREIYRSLVHHAAHLHAIKAQATNYTNEYRSAVGDIMHIQCSLKCAAEVSTAEAEEFASAAAAVDAYGFTSDSEQTMRDLAVAQDTIALLDTLLGMVAG